VIAHSTSVDDIVAVPPQPSTSSNYGICHYTDSWCLWGVDGKFSEEREAPILCLEALAGQSLIAYA
jgi:hypothetical protein